MPTHLNHKKDGFDNRKACRLCGGFCFGVRVSKVFCSARCRLRAFRRAIMTKVDFDFNNELAGA